MSKPSQGVRISELISCSPTERDKKLDLLFQAALNPTEGQLHQQSTAIEKQIAKFERRYEMSSSVMKKRLSAGLIKETAEICSWLMLLKAKDRFETKSTKTRAESI